MRFLFQSRDNGRVKRSDLKVVTKRAPAEQEIADMLFAFTVCKHVKSNAIVYAKDGATVGVGAGQMNRRDSSRIAALRAAESGEIAKLPQSPAVGSVVASDAFFPFADGLLAAAEAGATARPIQVHVPPARQCWRCRSGPHRWRRARP